jgi:DNA-binding response OmpR family regulator
MPIRLAIVDTDTEFLRPLTRRLDGLGWPHRTLASAVPPDELVPMRLDAIVLDTAVLGPQGWTYLAHLCASIPHLGIVVCTGRSSVAQRVRGLRMGADDWLSKPCHPEELIARVEAVVRRRRRAGEERAAEGLVAGEIELALGQFQASVAGAPLDLTRREFELLQLLAQSEGQVLQREDIYERVWGYAMVPGDRSVDVYVRKLRHKLERASPGWHYIHTHFGVGYRFSPAEIAERAVPAPAEPVPALT